MKFKNLFWLFSLVMFANLCFVSCDKDDDKSDKPSVQKDGVYCKELDSVLNLKKNAAIDSVGITILDEIPDFEIIKKALNDYPTIKVSLNLENCTGLNGIPDEALKPKEKDRKDGMTNLVSVTLPENITKIGKQAFCHCTRLTTIVIPQNVTFIGDYAFKGCNSMETITLQCTTPPELDGESFSKVHVFYVPESAVDTYKNDQKWKKFAKKITAIGTELIEEPEIEEILKFNNLTIEAHEDGTITIEGTITTNTKLKEFCLYQENGNIVVYDFLNHNTILKEKNSEFDENEMASKEKQYTLDITSAPIPVDIYQLSIKTKKGKVYRRKIFVFNRKQQLNNWSIFFHHKRQMLYIRRSESNTN